MEIPFGFAGIQSAPHNATARDPTIMLTMRQINSVNCQSCYAEFDTKDL